MQAVIIYLHIGLVLMIIYMISPPQGDAGDDQLADDLLLIMEFGAQFWYSNLKQKMSSKTGLF